jgi:hypothetical protein
VRNGVRVAAKPAADSQGGDGSHDDILMAAGPLGGKNSRRLREAIFRGNSLKPRIEDAVFQKGFDGMYLG